MEKFTSGILYSSLNRNILVANTKLFLLDGKYQMYVKQDGTYQIPFWYEHSKVKKEGDNIVFEETLSENYEFLFVYLEITPEIVAQGIYPKTEKTENKISMQPQMFVSLRKDISDKFLSS